VILIGEIVPILLVTAILLVARRYSAPKPPKGQSQTGSDADVAELVAAGRMIDAIKLYRIVHGTDLRTAKDAVEQMQAEQASRKRP
jgi:ribosomal protein L7/L12